MTSAIAPREFIRLRQDDPDLRVLDVRTAREFESMHIPGSLNIPLDTLDEHAGDLATVDHPVVLVCQSGGRASTAHQTLEHAGKSGVFVLDGGMNAWHAVGGEVSEGDTDHWPMDRQVRLVAGSMALGAVLVSVVIPQAKWLAAGVGSGLLFSAVSNTCAMANVLGKLPYNRDADGHTFNQVIKLTGGMLASEGKS